MDSNIVVQEKTWKASRMNYAAESGFLHERDKTKKRCGSGSHLLYSSLQQAFQYERCIIGFFFSVGL